MEGGFFFLFSRAVSSGLVTAANFLPSTLERLGLTFLKWQSFSATYALLFIGRSYSSVICKNKQQLLSLLLVSFGL